MLYHSTEKAVLHENWGTTVFFDELSEFENEIFWKAVFEVVDFANFQKTLFPVPCIDQKIFKIANSCSSWFGEYF